MAEYPSPRLAAQQLSRLTTGDARQQLARLLNEPKRFHPNDPDYNRTLDFNARLCTALRLEGASGRIFGSDDEPLSA